MTYSTLEDVRNFGVTEAMATDDRITAGLAIAKSRIDRYTGQFGSFGDQIIKTMTFDSIASQLVPLSPFTDVTLVTVNGSELDESDWEERDFGVFLKRGNYFDVDGFLLDAPIVSAFRNRSTITVSVSATFGTDVDETLTLASTILASAIATADVTDNLLPTQISSYMSEEIRITQSRAVGHTTGNLDVDAMLDDYQYGGDLIG